MGDAPQAIMALVERYGRNLHAYRSGRYREAQVHQELVDPLFAALGWWSR